MRKSFAVVGMLALVACREGSPATAPSPTTPPVSSSAPVVSTSPPAPPSPTRGPLGSGKSVTIAFGGDVHFEGASRSALSGGLAPITPLLSNADVTMVNLESAITGRGEPAPKAYTFRAPASAFGALRRAGVDVVSMANNHGLDYGVTGLRDSLAAAGAAKFPVVGVGLNARQAFAPWRTTVNGQRLAFLGASHVLDSNLASAWTAGPDKPGMASAYQEAELLAAVRAARETSDTVVVYLHWGRERSACPIDRQYDIAAKLSKAGADIVVGAHAHVLLGAGMLDDTFVAYGLGNFVFYARPGLGAQTGVLTVKVTGQRVDSYDWAPAEIRGGVPHPLSGSSARVAKDRWTALRGCTNLEP
ncbi:MAG TPA: CapA family protein [Frankiaceae bacterium]|nr:CapA family protein [Frankiaceae bacterium]